MGREELCENCFVGDELDKQQRNAGGHADCGYLPDFRGDVGYWPDRDFVGSR
jgi:hypothetical protein